MIIHSTNRSRTASQSGMVSILVTLIMMLVISLIVLGFAQISRREQRQSLDRQLSSQAYFAAESAVNDARTYIASLPAGAVIPEKPSCPTSTSISPYKFNPVLDNSVSYSCLLVTTKLKNIQITVPDNASSVNIPLQPSGGSLDSIHISWSLGTPPTASQVSNCAGTIPASGALPQNSAVGWQCPYGVLRVDIVPTNILSRAALTTRQKTIFLYPTKGGPSTTSYVTADGQLVAMKCTIYDCNAVLSNVPNNQYAVRLIGIYHGGLATIAGYAGGTALDLKNAQIQIDATGKAQDVLRRIQVRLAMLPAGETPDYAIESGSSICKRFELTPNFFKISGITGQDQANPMCSTTNVGANGYVMFTTTSGP